MNVIIIVRVIMLRERETYREILVYLEEVTDGCVIRLFLHQDYIGVIQ